MCLRVRARGPSWTAFVVSAAAAIDPSRPREEEEEEEKPHDLNKAFKVSLQPPPPPRVLFPRLSYLSSGEKAQNTRRATTC